MFTFKKERCGNCNGTGKVRFLLLFGRDCPLCYGSGQIDVPLYTIEGEARPLLVSALDPETLQILRTNPEPLYCLSPQNIARLRSKFTGLSSLYQPRPIRQIIQSPTENQRHINDMMMAARDQRIRFEEFIKQGADIARRGQDMADLANKQFRDFVAQGREMGR